MIQTSLTSQAPSAPLTLNLGLLGHVNKVVHIVGFLYGLRETLKVPLKSSTCM